MKMTLKISILFTGLFLCNFLFSQQFQITGKIVDEKNHPIEFAEILLLNQDSVAVKSELSNAAGIFSIRTANSNYILQVKHLKDIIYSRNVNLESNINLGNVKAGNVKEIKEVVIQGKKKLIERKVDRLIFNVENSIISQGVNGIEVLQNTPKIDLSRGGIQLIGKSSVGIMVNGRLLNLTGADMENYIKSMRSDNIARIEVITNPPAKYDAEGNSGLINIVLKKNANLGWKGNTSLSYTQRSYAGIAPSANLYYTGKKLSVAFSLSGNAEAKSPTSGREIEFSSTYRKSSEQKKENYTGVNSNMNINYSINEKNDIGLIYNGSFIKNDQKGNIMNYFMSKPLNQLDSLQHSPYKNVTKYNYHSLSTYYDLKLDTLGKKMSVYFNYLGKNNRSDRDFSTTTSSGLNNAALYGSKADYSIYSGNADFTLPYEFADIEAGVKYTSITNNSDISYFNVINGASIFNPSKSNEFNYKENIFALYFSATKEIVEKWEVQIGLRYENASTRGYSKTLNQTQHNKFDNFFPSVFVTYTPNKNNSFSIAYSKRIDRPGFYEVNPFRIYTDFYSYDSGNPNLIPSNTHNIELSYLYKNNLSVTLYGSRLAQGKDYITTVSDNSNSTISQPMNFYNQNTLGLDISYTYKPYKWFNSYNSLSGYYNDSKSYMEQLTIPSFSGYGAFVSTKNTFTLNDKKTSFLVLNFFQNLPTKEGFVKSFNRASLDLGLRLMFLDKSLQVNALISDIFAQNRNKNTEYYPTYNYFSTIYNDMRSFNLSISYSFGNKKIKTTNKKIENLEQSRL
ncbi:TonB-dependent receptor [Chryseobacterium sp. MYb7]|uniref:outer membrane beta-barrel family protein n=1 Tax=Chryseobacterium sp. MYb7 TaxID=1827290 RepID=UPI000CFF5693|nr:outer membrane beta-barrel family protein [Chryseobacterium sp. MYb7]PRA97539.1 TonB-dependent receptor [Chryseobacterium sp. MYb7]